MDQSFSGLDHHSANLSWNDHYYQSNNCYRTAAYMLQNSQTNGNSCMILVFFFNIFLNLFLRSDASYKSISSFSNSTLDN